MGGQRRATLRDVVLATGACLLLAAPASARDHLLRFLPQSPAADGYYVYLGFGEAPSGEPLDIGFVPADTEGVAEYWVTGLPDDLDVNIEMTAYQGDLESARSNRLVLAAINSVTTTTTLPSVTTTTQPTLPPTTSTTLPAQGGNSITTTTTRPPTTTTTLPPQGGNSVDPADLDSIDLKSLEKPDRRLVKKLKKAMRKASKTAAKVEKLGLRLEKLHQKRDDLQASTFSAKKLARIERKIERHEAKLQAWTAKLMERQADVVELESQVVVLLP